MDPLDGDRLRIPALPVELDLFGFVLNDFRRPDHAPLPRAAGPADEHAPFEEIHEPGDRGARHVSEDVDAGDGAALDHGPEEPPEEDPLAGVANLFDLAMVVGSAPMTLSAALTA